jgi:DNA helicase-2/ATP-dependent DNA helicase PcrA
MEIIYNIYEEIRILRGSLLSNENKAHNLRKLYEKLYKNLLDYQGKESVPTLHDMINEYIIKENKDDLQYLCHKLRKDLNPWSHDNLAKLSNEDLNNYFTMFNNIIFSLTGILPKENKNEEKEFLLSNLTLNDKQKEAVLSTNKITLVSAGPGTGKTHLIIARVLNEIQKNNEKKLFILSFTNKASDELKHKIDENIFLTNLSEFRKNIFTGTIHSFVLEAIQEYFNINNRIFDFIIIDEIEYKDLKEEFENDEQIVQKYLEDNRLLTFDSIMTLFIKTIKNNKNFQGFISNYIDEVIIDEAQDLDKFQYEILALLNKYINNLKLFFVGDQKQNIYAFKGGSLNNIKEYFKNENIFKVELEFSYRCPENTLLFVNNFTFNDCENPPLKNARNDQGNLLKVEEFKTTKNEGNWIAKLIKSKNKEGTSLSEISIIYPNTFYFKNILESLNDFEIPFKVMGGQYFLDKNIRLIRYILNYIYTKNKFALRSIQTNFIKYELNYDNVDDLLKSLEPNEKNYQKLNLKCVLQFIKVSDDNKSTLEILNELSRFCEANKNFSIEFINRINELIVIIENDLILENYEKLKISFSPMHPTLGNFYSRSDKIVLSEYFEEGKEYVTITTVHSAKGLEWDVVIIPGMSQDSFPRYFKFEKDAQKELPNELKKFYVACTRTKQELFFTRAILNNWGYKKDKSIFIKNL